MEWGKPASWFDSPLRLCVLARNKDCIFRGRAGGERRERLISRKRAKATARMFAGEFSGPRQVSWSIDPSAAEAWALREKRFWRLPPPTLEELPILPSK